MCDRWKVAQRSTESEEGGGAENVTVLPGLLWLAAEPLQLTGVGGWGMRVSVK